MFKNVFQRMARFDCIKSVKASIIGECSDFFVTLEPRISFENEHMEVIMCVQVSLPKC